MIYKGYEGHVEYDDEAGIFYGEVINIRDVITFQGCSVEEIRKEFRESVDVYLDFCKRRGEEPDKPFSGKFVVRIPADLHRQAYASARRSGKSLNAWVKDVLDRAVETKLYQSTTGK